MDLAGQLHGLAIVPVIWKYKENKKRRLSNQKFKPRISKTRNGFQYYQQPFILKYIKFYFYAALDK
jgi:hypothetical protein